MNDSLEQIIAEMRDTRNAWMVGSIWADRLSALSSARPESVGGVPVAVQTAPGQIWLQIGDDAELMNEPFPHDCGEELTWCQDSVLAAEVRYIRDDLVSLRSFESVTALEGGLVSETVSNETPATEQSRHHSPRSVAADVTDAMVERALDVVYDGIAPSGPVELKAQMRAALEAALNVKPDGAVAKDNDA